MAFSRASRNNAYPEILMKFTVNSNVTITAVSGDITLLQADAVVVGEDQWLAGAGGSSGAIARAGGHAYVTAKQALQSQQLPAGPTSVLWCEAGHSLPFHRVYHAILPKMSKHWSSEQRRTALAALYTRVCEEAEDQNQETSIVFPVLGSGQAGGGAEDSVWAALDGLEAFPATSLREVFLVEKDQQRANKMVAVCQRWIQSQQSKNAHVTILPLDSFSGALPGMAPTWHKTTMYQTGSGSSNGPLHGGSFSQFLNCANSYYAQGEYVQGSQATADQLFSGGWTSRHASRPNQYDSPQSAPRIVGNNYHTQQVTSGRMTGSYNTASLSSAGKGQRGPTPIGYSSVLSPSDEVKSFGRSGRYFVSQGTQESLRSAHNRFRKCHEENRGGLLDCSPRPEQVFGEDSSRSPISAASFHEANQPSSSNRKWAEGRTERSRANGGLGNFNYHTETVVRRREEKQTAQGTRSRGRALKATSGSPWNNPSVYEGEAFPRDYSEEEDDLPPAVEILSLDEDSEEYRFEVEDASFPTRQRRKDATSTGESKDFSRSLRKLAPEVREQASMPTGRMSHCVHDDVQLPGHEGFGVIVIDYVIPDGTQGPEHPQPGSPYSGSVERAFLPDTGQGRHVLTLLEKAFDRRLTFQVCVQPGGQALVEWADIPHKTCFRGLRDRGGYPDCDYLATVQDVLRDKYGIE